MSGATAVTPGQHGGGGRVPVGPILLPLHWWPTGLGGGTKP